MMKFKIYLSFILILFVFPSFSQKEVRKQLREGNAQYNKEHYTESEIAYRKALEENTRSVEAAYNLGNSLYKQGKLKEAMEQYQVVLAESKDKKIEGKTWHNLGNIFMNAKDYGKSIAAYKQSLINDPKDNETRYNLALAQKLLNDQQQNQDKNQQDKDKKEQEQQQQEKQNQQDKKEEQEKQNQQDNSNIDKEKADQILEALSQDEKKTQNKVKEQEAKKQMSRNKPDKDW